MKFYNSFLIFGYLLGWISAVYGRDVTFNVIAFKSINVYLDMEGTKYKMIKSDPDIPLFTVIVKDLSIERLK